MHLRADETGWDPFPPTQRTNDHADRRAANRVLCVSAVGLALTGFAELAISLLSGSVSLLGDALHNLADVSTSLVVFLGFSISRRSATASHLYGYERRRGRMASAVFAATVSVHKLTEHGRTSKPGPGHRRGRSPHPGQSTRGPLQAPGRPSDQLRHADR